MITITEQAVKQIQIAAEKGDMEAYLACFEPKSREALPPLALGRARERWGHPFSPAHVVVVGDTPADIACARANGLRVVAVATGWHSVAQLAALHPDALFADVRATEKVVAALLA